MNANVHSVTYDNIDEEDFDYKHPSIQKSMDIAEVVSLLDSSSQRAEELKTLQEKLATELRRNSENHRTERKATEPKVEEPKAES